MAPTLGRSSIVVLVLALLLPAPSAAQQGPILLPDPTFDAATLEAARLLRPSVGMIPPEEVTNRINAAAQTGVDPIALRCLAQMSDSVRSYGCPAVTFGLDTPDAVEAYFGGLRIGSVAALSLGDEQAALYTELLSDNLWIATWPGYARLGLSAQVAAAGDTVSSTATQFFQGGGNAVIHASVPTFAYLNYVRPEVGDVPTLIRRVDVLTTLAVGTDVPAMSTPATEVASNVRLGLDGTGHWAADANLFRFFAQVSGYAVVGTEAFYDNLVGEEIDVGVRPFLAGSATVGVDLANLVRVGVRVGGATIEGVSQKAQFTVQLLPQAQRSGSRTAAP